MGSRYARRFQHLASKKITRTILNKYYTSPDDEAKSRFYARYAKTFRKRGVLTAGEWVIDFAGQKILLPLRPFWSWLDWDSAVSIIGHAIDVKQTYAALVTSDLRRGDRGALRRVRCEVHGRRCLSVLWLSAGSYFLQRVVAQRWTLYQLAPQERRQKTMEALTAQIERLSRQKPVMVILEDARWIDTTSLEVLGRLVDRIRAFGVLLIVTFRRVI
jgi:hypothetical protein